MAWSASKIFQAMIIDGMGNTTAFDLDGDTPKIALFDNSLTPSQTVTSANTAYGAGVWAAGGISDASGWPAAGRAVTSPTWTASGGVCTYTVAALSSANANTTLVGTYGCLVYDDTLAAVVVDQGMCYLYFGGTQTVTAGTFTITPAAGGIFALTL